MTGDGITAVAFLLSSRHKWKWRVGSDYDACKDFSAKTGQITKPLLRCQAGQNCKKSQNGLVCFFASLNHASIILLLSPTWESALTRSNWRASSRKTTVQDITAPERSRCCCMGHRRCITPSLPSIFCSLGNWHVKKAAGHPYFSSLRHAFTL